uniref:Uncharacterized protein n=1 Tax=Rhodnius prolixus TaxID=13249 RepID=T1HSY8_RHOPR
MAGTFGKNGRGSSTEKAFPELARRKEESGKTSEGGGNINYSQRYFRGFVCAGDSTSFIVCAAFLGFVCAGDSTSFIVCAAFLGFVCAGDSPSFIVCAAFLEAMPLLALSNIEEVVDLSYYVGLHSYDGKLELMIGEKEFESF